MKLEDKGTKSRYGTVNFEKRKYPRFKVDLPIEYHQINSTIHHNGRVLNASEGGLLIYFPDPVKLGQHLNVKLFFASGSTMNTLEMVVEVVWMDIHLNKGWGDYRCGVRFVDICSEDMSKLKSFLRSLSE
jgi:c-di-GMP-binding flagellar brake protein YcgR